MNLNFILAIIFLSLAVTGLQAQTRKLDKKEFQRDIVEQWWSFENKENNETSTDCDMRIFVIKAAGFELNCVNWTAGFTGNKCFYDLTLTDNFFELKSKNCQNNISPGFLYGYMTETDQLVLLISKKQLAISAALLSEKGWLKFEKIKR